MTTTDRNRRIGSTTSLSGRYSVEGVYLRRILGWIVIVIVIGVELILANHPAIGLVVITIAFAGIVRLRSRTQSRQLPPDSESAWHDPEDPHRLAQRPLIVSGAPTKPSDLAGTNVETASASAKIRIDRNP